jgi:hypothetical protein
MQKHWGLFFRALNLFLLCEWSNISGPGLKLIAGSTYIFSPALWLFIGSLWNCLCKLWCQGLDMFQLCFRYCISHEVQPRVSFSFRGNWAQDEVVKLIFLFMLVLDGRADHLGCAKIFWQNTLVNILSTDPHILEMNSIYFHIPMLW